MNEYTKISDSEMEVVKDAPVVEPITTKYSIDFLKKQELDILTQMNDYVDQRKKELEEVRVLLVEAGKLGLKTEATLRDEAVVAEEATLPE